MLKMMARCSGLVAFASPHEVQRKHPKHRYALRGQLLQEVLQGGGMGPSTSEDLKTTGSEVSPTNVAIVRDEMKDVELSLFFADW